MWALQDYGFQAVISSRFADIFRNNALKGGLVPVTVPEPVVAHDHGGARRRRRDRDHRRCRQPPRRGARRSGSTNRSISTTTPSIACSKASTTSGSPKPTTAEIARFESTPLRLPSGGRRRLTAQGIREHDRRALYERVGHDAGAEPLERRAQDAEHRTEWGDQRKTPRLPRASPGRGAPARTNRLRNDPDCGSPAVDQSAHAAAPERTTPRRSVRRRPR